MKLVLLLSLAALSCAHGAAHDGRQRENTAHSPEVVAAVAATEVSAPLPSWREGAPKQALLDFVARVTRENGETFVPPSERIAVLDNDGTLWSEQPVPVQFAFAIDRVRALAPQHPDWRTRAPFDAVLSGDPKALSRLSEQAILELIAATHAGMTSDEFSAIAVDWSKTARHPRFQRPYTELVYQPMLEVLRHLRANGFETYIVTGGGVEFVRAFAEQIYGIPPEHVIGSTGKLEYRVTAGEPSLERLPGVDFVDDKAGKPVAIQKIIGRRPILAIGNSDGDFEMLEWTTTGNPLPHLAVLLHHTDSEREFAYDREAASGRLSRALDEGPSRGWVIVDMKRDFARVFPFENTRPSPR